MGVTPPQHKKGITLPDTNDTTPQPAPEDRIQWIYASTGVDELEERYDRWAADYDSDLLNEFGWLAPQQAADVFRRYVPTSARVLDAGAGTGLVGESLKRLGYSNIEALDLSLGMLEEARKKNAYSAFHQMTLGETLDFATGTFAIVQAAAAQPFAGNLTLASLAFWGFFLGFAFKVPSFPFQDELAASGKWTLEEATEPLASLPKGEPDVLFQVWVYRVDSS